MKIRQVRREEPSDLAQREFQKYLDYLLKERASHTGSPKIRKTFTYLYLYLSNQFFSNVGHSFVENRIVK